MILRIVSFSAGQKNRQSIKLFMTMFVWLKKRKLFFIFVLMPWALITFYLLAVKTPVYESTATILFHQDMTHLSMNRLKSVFGKVQSQAGPSDSTPIYLIQKFIYSEHMLTELLSATDIKDHYQSSQVDFISRLKKNPNLKEFHNYYLKKIKLSVDATTGELVISVRAFSSEKAKEFLTLIIEKATKFLKKVNDASLVDQSKLVQKNLGFSRQQLIMAEFALAAALKTSNSDSNKVVVLKKLELKFAKIEYESYQQAYVIWSMSQKKNTPVQTVTPNLPDYYSSPRIPYDLISLLVVLSVIFLLVKMVFLVVREHVD